MKWWLLAAAALLPVATLGFYAGRNWVTISQQPVEAAYAPISRLRIQIAVAAAMVKTPAR